MLRRARVPVAMSDTELRAFTRRRSHTRRAVRHAFAWTGFLVMLYFDVYGFLALCNRMGWFGGAQ